MSRHALLRAGLRSVALLVLCATSALAQVRIVGSISGTVADASGGVIPGATVQLTDQNTANKRETVTSDSGSFTFPDLNSGTYEVTVTLQGFQTAKYTAVAVESSRTTDLRITLQPGGLTEVIQVEGASPVLVMTSNTVAGTLNNQSLNQLPLSGQGRNAFDFARLAPGVAQPLGGGTHFNGMPGGVINPTIDGVNNSSNGFKSGGTSFFGTVRARLGAMEEVTVESAGLDAESGAQGGVNLKFVTRRGTNQYHGSVFEQFRNEALNANTYANTSRNIAKPEFRRHDFGGNFGGPLAPFGGWRDKLFLFLNYEQEYIPQTSNITRTVLTDEASQGIFRYQTAAGEQRTANLLQIAAANGFQSSTDPTLMALLARQRSSYGAGALSSTNNLRTQSFIWEEPQKQINYYPTARLDYQITPTLSWMGSWNLYRQDNEGRRFWPLPDNPLQEKFVASWWITSTGLNWAINTNTHNEFRYGVQHSGDTTPGRELENYALNGIVNGLPARFSLPLGLSMNTLNAAPITGRHYITTLYDTMTLLRGNHTVKLGGTFRATEWRDTSLDGAGSAGVLGLPQYQIGSPTGDPVQGIFNTTSMPGVQSADLADVYALYALMTGRLARVQTGKVVDPETRQYSATAYRENWTSAKMGGIFAQDSWRVTPSLTINAGLRWDFNGAPHNHLGVANFPDVANLYGPSTALFQPGTLNGVANPIIRAGKDAAPMDWFNPGPNAGFAWTPRFGDSILGTIFGKGDDTVIRGSYNLTYYDEGTNMFASTAGNNPGQSQSLDLRPGLPGFAPGQLTLQSALPAYAVFPLAYAETFPQSIFTFGTTGFSTMAEDLKAPYVQAWNIGVQRQIMKNTVVELRYMGNRSTNVWRTFNLNEVNIFENGFLQEFKNAQQNLAINVANGRTGFANQNLPGQVALPIFEAAFGARGSQAAVPAASGFTNGGFITNLQQGTAGNLATSLATSSLYTCRMVGNTFSPCASLGFDAAGPYPMNFFLVNPYSIGGSLNLVDDDSYTNYHALQVQLRRRYYRGLSLNMNYTLSRTNADIWADNATQTVNYRTLRDRGLDNGPSPFDLRQTLQLYGTYDLPFGKNRKVSISNPVLDAVVGGWTLGGILTAQSGTPFRLTSGRGTVNGSGTNNGADNGIVLAGGMTVKQLQQMIKISNGPGFARYWIDPSLIGPDGRANPAFLAPPTTPGEFGEFIYLRGKNFWNLDGSLNKPVGVLNSVRFNLHITASNVLNHPVWSAPGFLSDVNITSTTFGQTTQPANNNTARSLYVRLEVIF